MKSIVFNVEVIDSKANARIDSLKSVNPETMNLLADKYGDTGIRRFIRDVKRLKYLKKLSNEDIIMCLAENLDMSEVEEIARRKND